jgi:heterodisulfide reductase subunit B
MTLCKCCHGSLKKAAHLMKEDSSFADEINPLLAKEGLSFDGEIEITHFLEVLHKKIGLQLLKEKIARTYKDLGIATHYGCHALRPSEIMQFDNPVAPVLFDQLVEVTGAKSIDWSLKLECCGAPLLGINDDLSMDLTAQKLKNGKQAGADYLCVACPWCQIQFDHVQKQMHPNHESNGLLPSILYPQLLGLAMGADPQRLGLEMNQIDIGNLETFLA